MITIFHDLNEKQKEVVQQIKGSLLVMAPVGTGKTKVITHRAAYAIRMGITPSKILCLSFTNRASREIKDRVSSFLGNTAREISVRTFHSLCAYLIRCEASRIGIDADFTIYDEEDAKHVLGQIWREQNIKVFRRDYERFENLLFNFIEDVKLAPYNGISPKSLNEIFQNLLWSTHLYETSKNQNFNPETIFNKYNKQLSDNHALDFADLIVHVHELFNENPNVLSKWQNTYEWIQVDEVQDTNCSEYLIISQLAKEHKNLAFFGDIDQTIYEWRGSVPYRILERFKSEFAPVKEITFNKNYRSTRTILQACQAVISRYQKAVTKKIEPEAREIGEKLIVQSARTLEEEARWIASQIKDARKNLGLSYRDIAVLTRTNLLGATISNVFERAGIPHFLVEQFKFFRRAEIKDAVAYIRILLNRYDANSLMRVLARPPKGIGQATIEKIREIPRNVGLKLVDFADSQTLQFGDPFGLLLEKFFENKVVVFDVETTGLDVHKDEIIEIAALKIGKKGIIARFHEYVKNSRPVGDSYKVHGISDDYLALKGKDPAGVFRAFLKFIEGCVLVGHNVYYDVSILKSKLRRVGFSEAVTGHCYDTLEMARRFYNLPKYNLKSICKELTIGKIPTHRAADDVEATAELLNILIPHIENKKTDREKLIGEFGGHFQKLANILEQWRVAIEDTRPKILLEKILKESGLSDYWAKQENGEKRVKNLKELVALFDRFDDEALPVAEALQNILTMVSLGHEADRYLQYDDRVLILTVHQAKGLEFDTVFVAGATDNEFPSWKSQREGREDEEHRLFYVAMTRAKKRLFLSYFKINNFLRPQVCSRYIRMIPRNLVTFLEG